MSFIKRLFGSKDLKSYLNETRVVVCKGVRFKIRRLNNFDYLDGSQTLVSYYELYKAGKLKEAQASYSKVKKFYTDVLMSSVVEPKLTRKEDDGSESIYVGEIINDMGMVSELYAQIMAFTDGKKKLKF